MDLQTTQTQLQSKWVKVKQLPWGQWLIILLLVLAILAMGISLYNHFWPTKPITSVPVVAQEASKAEGVPKIEVQGPKHLQVYKKEELGKKIPMVPEVANNPQLQPTATAQLVPMPYGGTATSFTNMTSGHSLISVTPKSRPLFGFGGKTGIGALGGSTTRGSVAIGYVSQDVVRVGPVNIGIAAGLGVIGSDSLMGAAVHIHGEF